MKKIVIVLCTLLTACSLFQEKEERFVNSLFYETLSCIPRDYEIHLSPKKLTSTAHAPFDEMTCSLLKNESTEIILSCTTKESPPYTLLFKYVLTDFYHYKGCRVVEQYTYRPNTTEWNGRTGYCLHAGTI